MYVYFRPVPRILLCQPSSVPRHLARRVRARRGHPPHLGAYSAAEHRGVGVRDTGGRSPKSNITCRPANIYQNTPNYTSFALVTSNAADLINRAHPRARR